MRLCPAALSKLAMAVAISVVAISSCSSNHSEIPAGHALSLEKSSNAGLSYGMSISDSNFRSTYSFACAELNNVSASPLTYESAKIIKVPSTVEVVGYELLNSQETHGVMLSSENGTDVGSYSRYKDHTSEHPVVPAHTWSLYYPIVKVKLLKMVPATMSKCQILYKQHGILYQQITRTIFIFN